MTGLARVATWKSGVDAVAVSLTVNGQTYSRNHANIPRNATAAQLEEAVATWAAGRGIILPEFHIHRNRDNSFVVVFGPAPDVWPEDVTE